MSWDVTIFDLGGKPPPPLARLREDDLRPLGPADDVRRRISALLGDVDWSDPTWGVYATDSFSIEFNVGDDDPIESIMLHVRGGGDPIAAIVRFAKPLGWSVLDGTMGEFLDLEDPSQAGWDGFRRYRDKIFDR